MLISEFEAKLLDMFPVSDAESWDRPGLSVGRPADEVRGVTLALNATCDTIQQAFDNGSNVLLTHHPICIDWPQALTPASTEVSSASAAIYKAIELGISVISLHTNLDRSFQARLQLPALLGFEATSSLEFPQAAEKPGLGSLVHVQEADLCVGDLALRCEKAFDCQPTVWGRPDYPVHSIAILGGSLGHMTDMIANCEVDMVITGEVGYHVALDLYERGISLILLGHDCSENPFCTLLYNASVAAGIDADLIDFAHFECPWWTSRKENK